MTTDVFGDARLPARFWSRVERTASCWLWTGGTSCGYGRVSIGGIRRPAHLHSFTALVDAIPSGMEIDHRCRNRACVNPAHLQRVDKKGNGENRAGANRNSKSGVRGVSWDASRGKWFVQAHSRGRTHVAGRFDSIQDAERAVIALRNQLFTNNLADRETP